MSEYHESPEDEVPDPIDGSQIRHLLAYWGILDKIWMDPDDGGAAAIRECNVSEEIANKLGGRWRGNMHLVRLLRRPGVEREFALAFLRNKIVFEDELIAGEVNSVIAGEGSDTTMFWTFAPYLLKVLMGGGMEERVAIEKILIWASDGVSLTTLFKRGDTTDLHLKGAEAYAKNSIPKMWILDQDPNHISHRYTAQEAERIAKLLIDHT